MDGIRLIAGVAAIMPLMLVRPGRADDARLADAAEHRDSALIIRLLKEHADSNAAQVDGMTALHWATLHDDADTVKRLLAAGAEVNAKNRYGVTPLTLACASGNADVVSQLLKAGADVKATLRGGETALMTAARVGRVVVVKQLLDDGADVNAHERNGQTALMWAAAEGHDEVVEALLTAGADLHAHLALGFTPLFFAVREGRQDVVKRLLDAGEEVNQVLKPQSKANARPTTPLLLAIENGHFELAASLLAAGADPNDKPAGYTALHAIMWVRKPIRGDVNPPPHGSGRLNSLDMVRELVKHGAAINALLEKGVPESGQYTPAGSTPFLMAARCSDVPLLKLLLELGADPKIPNADGSTPLLAAAGVGQLENGEEMPGTEAEAVETVRFLLDRGEDINAVDANGETAVHGAAYQSWPKLVRFLSECGADVKVWNRPNKQGWTPLVVACGKRAKTYRPSPETVAEVERVMRAGGVTPSVVK